MTAWVDGDRGPKDRTLFVMETRARRSRLPTVEEHEKREKHRLREFFNWYPAAAVLICLLLTAVLMFTVLQMPGFGRADNPLHNQVSEHYIEHGKEDSGAANVVTAMILTYRGFDTLGESCVLFLAVTSVMMLLLRDEKNTDGRDLAPDGPGGRHPAGAPGRHSQGGRGDPHPLHFPLCRLCAAQRRDLSRRRLLRRYHSRQRWSCSPAPSASTSCGPL